MKRSNAGVQLNNGTVMDLGKETHQENLYAQTLWTLHEWIWREILANHSTVIQTDKQSENFFARGYNSPRSFKVPVVIARVKTGEVATGNVIRKRDAISRNGCQVLNEISVAQCVYELLHYLLIFPKSSDGWYLQKVLEYGMDSTPALNEDDVNGILVEESFQPVLISNESQPSEITEAQESHEEANGRKNRNHIRQFQFCRRQIRP